LFDETQRLLQETERRERETSALSEVGRDLSSTLDLATVMDRIAAHAKELLAAQNSAIFLPDEGTGRYRAIVALGDLAAQLKATSIAPGQGIIGSLLQSGQAEFINSSAADPRALQIPGTATRSDERLMVVPLLAGEVVQGAMAVWRTGGAPFEARELAFLEGLSRQATIALGNARLFDETQEALERQTATAEILKVIARSPSDVQPVLDAIVESAKRLIGGFSATAFRVFDGVVHLAAYTATDEAGAAALLARFPAPLPSFYGFEPMRSGRAIQVEDTDSDPRLTEEWRELARQRHYRANLNVPMLRDGAPIGMISVTRAEPGPFAPHHVALLETFAAQAVIAIENVRLFNDTQEALERQTATAEILKVIAQSPSDVQPVLDAIVASAKRLVDGYSATVWRRNGELLRLAAYTQAGESADHVLQRFGDGLAVDEQFALDPLRTGLPIQIADVFSDVRATEAHRELARARGFRALANVPLMREGVAIGLISVTRVDAGEFTAHQIELLQTFAAQAVIAIENVRLFNETQTALHAVEERTVELTESLEYQTAISHVLRVISESPTEVSPVFEAIMDCAMRLFESQHVAIFRYDGQLVDLAATRNWTREALDKAQVAYPMPVDAGTMNGRVILSGLPHAIDDLASDQHYRLKSLASAGQWRRMLGAPMLKDGVPVGAIVVAWPEPGPTPQRRIDLLKTFADQAVIAIENVRLFNETQDALERQTATAEVLQVISSSVADAQPVFDAIVHSAARLFGRKTALRTVEPDGLRRRARSYDATADEFHGPELVPIDRRSVVGRAVLEGRAVQVADNRAPGHDAFVASQARELAFRSIASAPLMQDGVAIGVISMSSPEPGALSDRQMELLTTFADQAVIAIQNARLFNETKEALERQTATAEVLKVISASPSDVLPVFEAIAASSKRLLNAFSTTVFRIIDGVLHLEAYTPTNAEADAALTAMFPRPIAEFPPIALIQDGRIASIADTEADASVPAMLRDLARLRGYRSMLYMPLMRDGQVVGLIAVTRQPPGPWAEHHQQLLRTFADQAVIAIENVRLFNETREALEFQTATADVLGVIGHSMSDAAPVFEKIIERCEQLFSAQAFGLALVDEQGQVGMPVMRVTAAARAEVGEAQAAAVLARTLAAFPRPLAGTLTEKAIRSGSLIEIRDVFATADASQPAAQAAAQLG
ncbi:MAG TPA: GAF domain-containing protein, partial [Rubrivivax sp.]|nr:GAF domain-containing protein [Rubrivivax sp.]